MQGSFSKTYPLPQRHFYGRTKRPTLTSTTSCMFVLTFDRKPIDFSNVRHHPSLAISSRHKRKQSYVPYVSKIQQKNVAPILVMEELLLHPLQSTQTTDDFKDNHLTLAGNMTSRIHMFMSKQYHAYHIQSQYSSLYLCYFHPHK